MNRLKNPVPLLRSRAREVKFFLPMNLALEVKEWSRKVMPPDSHVPVSNHQQYQVTSLYFDTPQWDVFSKQGSYGRSKYRIRCYGEERTAFLERKIKTCGQISKWRLPVPLEDLLYLTHTSSPFWEGDWFQRRLRLRRLEPVCRIQYRRLARESQDRFGRFRLTLDESIFGEAIRIPSFADRAADPGRIDCCPEGMILELKYSETMPVIFKQLIEDFRLSEGSFSKYRSAVEKLGLTPNFLSSHA